MAAVFLTSAGWLVHTCLALWRWTTRWVWGHLLMGCITIFELFACLLAGSCCYLFCCRAGMHCAASCRSAWQCWWKGGCRGVVVKCRACVVGVGSGTPQEVWELLQQQRLLLLAPWRFSCRDASCAIVGGTIGGGRRVIVLCVLVVHLLSSGHCCDAGVVYLQQSRSGNAVGQ